MVGAVKSSKEEKIVSAVIVVIMLLLTLIFLLPFLLVLGSSFLSPAEYAQRGMVMIPRHPTFATYKLLLTSSMEIWNAYAVSFFRTGIGTILNLLVSAMLAYGISKEKLPGRKVIITLLFITMIFNGGLIPNYIVVSNLHLTDTLWCMLLPNLVNVWNVFVLRNFFRTIPESIMESATIDGASEGTIFSKIVLPLSKPALATIGIYYAVAHWNSWFDAAIYLNKRTNLYPLQLIVRKYIQSADTYSLQGGLVGGMMRPSSMTIKAAVIVLTALPMLVIYPFLQKYFVKGIVMGSVKG